MATQYPSIFLPLKTICKKKNQEALKKNIQNTLQYHFQSCHLQWTQDPFKQLKVLKKNKHQNQEA